jgi:hypothetical protein
MATAFPQCLGLTKDVTVVIPDGRYVPAEIPRRNTQHRTANRLLLKEMAESVMPTAMAETAMVLLWLIREDICPDPKSDMKYPMERKKNNEPASPWLNPKLISIVGSNGAKTIREVKFNKKMDAMRKSGMSWDLNVSSPNELFLLIEVVSAPFKF